MFGIPRGDDVWNDGILRCPGSKLVGWGWRELAGVLKCHGFSSGDQPDFSPED